MLKDRKELMTTALLPVSGEHVSLMVLFLFKAHHQQIKIPFESSSSLASFG